MGDSYDEQCCRMEALFSQCHLQEVGKRTAGKSNGLNYRDLLKMA
jgi:hypothetical protein